VLRRTLIGLTALLCAATVRAQMTEQEMSDYISSRLDFPYQVETPYYVQNDDVPIAASGIADIKVTSSNYTPFIVQIGVDDELTTVLYGGDTFQVHLGHEYEVEAVEAVGGRLLFAPEGSTPADLEVIVDEVNSTNVPVSQRTWSGVKALYR